MKINFVQKVRLFAYSQTHIWSFLGIFIILLCLWIVSFANAQEQYPEDPMESETSQLVRAKFAVCREEKDLALRYLCTCKVLEEQCISPRKLTDGDWKTVEFWPSENPAEREVQFILFADIDALGEFAPINKGLVVTCMAGIAEINIFVGEDVDESDNPVVYLGDKASETSFDREDNLFTFTNVAEIYGAILMGDTLRLTYSDNEKIERELYFDTFGFDNVSKGWGKLCKETSS